MKILSTFVVILLLLLSLYGFGADKVQPTFHPRLEIGKAIGEIKIDGKLDDSGWLGAKRIDQFVERSPGENLTPDVKTEVAITYDENNLYVGFKCYDKPDAIRATVCQRDQFSSDDDVAVLLDTYGTATTAYEFYVNPYGVQKDGLWSSVAGSDNGVDFVWKSAAVRTDSGYQVEMAIPFASIRFPNQDVQTWKMDFWRDYPRESYKTFNWAGIDRNEQCWPCQWGTVEGIRNVEPGKGVEILPALVAHQTSELSNGNDPNSGFNNEDIKGQLSIGGKYALSSDVTTEAAYNPDFSQIESDAAQIDVNTTIALRYPEKRPYFQEGSDIFQTMFNSFYTRMINNPQYTAKLTGRMNSTSIAFITAQDKNSPYIIPLAEQTLSLNAGKSFVNVLRGIHTFDDNSKLGFLISDRRFENQGSGTVLSLDGVLRLSNVYQLRGQYISTYTKEPDNPSLTSRWSGATFEHGKYTVDFDGESYSGTGLITQFRRIGRDLTFVLDFTEVAPSYRTETGYDPVADYKSFTPSINYNFYPESSLVTRITPHFQSYNRWNYDGIKKQEHYTFGFDGTLAFTQMHFNTYFDKYFEAFQGVRFENLWQYYAGIENQFSDALGTALYFYHGPAIAYYAMARDKETGYEVTFTLKPVDRLIIDQDVNYLKSNDAETGVEFFHGYISRTRCQLQFTSEFSSRLVVQYNDFNKIWDVDPLLTYRLNPFTVLYVGSTYNYQQYDMSPQASLWQMTARQYFMKIQYLIQS
jgi:hypothetical protein